MRKRLLSHLPTLFLSVSLCSVALVAHAQDADQAQSDTEAAPGTSSPTIPFAYQVTPGTGMQYGTGAPYTETTRRWPNRPLLSTSAFTFTAAYLPAVITAAVNDDETSNNLFIPVAGPWLELANEDTSSGNKALLAISGVFQDLGALGMLSSLFIPESRTSRWYLMGNERFTAAPVATRDTYGLSARGRF